MTCHEPCISTQITGFHIVCSANAQLLLCNASENKMEITSDNLGINIQNTKPIVVLYCTMHNHDQRPYIKTGYNRGGFLQSNHITGSRPDLRQSKFQNSLQVFSASTDSNVRVNTATNTTYRLCLLQQALFYSPSSGDCTASWQRNLILSAPCL